MKTVKSDFIPVINSLPHDRLAEMIDKLQRSVYHGPAFKFCATQVIRDYVPGTNTSITLSTINAVWDMAERRYNQIRPIN